MTKIALGALVGKMVAVGVFTLALGCGLGESNPIPPAPVTSTPAEDDPTWSCRYHGDLVCPEDLNPRR